MALKWVRSTRTLYRTNEAGVRVRYEAGDWFQARNMEIRQRLAKGEVVLGSDLYDSQIFDIESCGVVTSSTNSGATSFGSAGAGLTVTFSTEYELEFPYTYFWDGSLLRSELLPISFELLKTWEMAVPIESFDLLPTMIGSEGDRELTRSVIGDLRVPVYHIGHIYAKRCDSVYRLLDTWEVERNRIERSDPRLSFLRALYQVPLLLMSLPPSWLSGIHE